MKQGFEDAFTDAQERMVSLFLELLEGIEVDKCYIFAFQNEIQRFFNGFVERNGEVLYLNKVISNKDLIFEFLKLGAEDIANIVKVCNEYEAECPNLIKISYNVNTHSFDADYGYSDVIEEGGSLVQLFTGWHDEIQKAL